MRRIKRLSTFDRLHVCLKSLRIWMNLGSMRGLQWKDLLSRMRLRIIVLRR